MILPESSTGYQSEALPVFWGDGESFLSLTHGIPSHDTSRRVVMRIDPDAFETGFSAWAQSCAEAFEREVVVIGTSRLVSAHEP
jgi:hypothetical protein